MSNHTTSPFQNALEVIESLPEEQQESLIDIVRRRIIERRREILAKNIHEARQEYLRGDVKRGTVDDLLKELSDSI